MYVDTYQHPYELQRDEAAPRENLAPNGRDEIRVAVPALYDEAGRIPYEDIC